MLITLVISFFITAALYASVGFGGGSTYNSLLVLSGVDYRILPAIALTCNIIVVSGGTLRFWQRGLLSIRDLSPFLAASVPAAWIGGRLNVSEIVFVGLLGLALLFAGLRMVTQPNPQAGPVNRQSGWPLFTISIAVGGLIGFISGLVGIGGGIFLAPVLYFLNWGSPRRIAAACSLFILANSVSGLTGQLAKLGEASILSAAIPYWPLLLSVLVGGQIGSWAASQSFRPATIKRLTSVLILYVALRLLYRWSSLVGWT